MAQATYEQVRHEFAQRVQHGEFLAVGHGEGRAAPLYTTAEMVRMEQEIIGRMQSGNQRTYTDPIAGFASAADCHRGPPYGVESGTAPSGR
jgi:hypothetical protein